MFVDKWDKKLALGSYNLNSNGHPGYITKSTTYNNMTALEVYVAASIFSVHPM